MKKLIASLLLTTAGSLLAVSPAAAQQMKLLERSGDGVELTDKAVSGQELLGATLEDVETPIGTVEDIILDDRGEIAFIKYETSRFRDLDGEGYMPVGDIELETQSAFNVAIDTSNIDDAGAVEEMRLDEEEQRSRMLSNILRDEVMVGRDVYSVRDVAFDRDGQARYLIVSENTGGFLRSGEAFAIDWNRVSYEDGAWRANTSRRRMPMLLISTYDIED